MLEKIFRLMSSKGQALVFLAISAPILFVLVGAAADFGWIYLNQSRLQNAADAAVVAGAKALISTSNTDTSGYSYSKLVSNHDENFLRLVREKVISDKNTSFGDRAAQRYARFNLSGFLVDNDADLQITDVQAENSFSDKWNNITFQHMLYGADIEDDGAMYYTVVLSEKLNHLFPAIMEYFNIGTVSARAMAVAKITYHIDNDPVPKIKGISLYQQMKLVRNKNNYADWYKIKEKYQKELDKAANDEELKNLLLMKHKTLDLTTITRSISVQAKGNEYVEGNFYRTETLTLHGWSKASTGNGNTTGGSLDQRNFDNLFVDFKIDRSGNFKDTDYGSTSGGVYNLYTNNKSINDETVLKYRIHDLINIGKWNGYEYEYPYKVRSGKEYPDPLYVYIESEDNYVDGSSGNTVRQMIINVNADNTSYEDRPMFLFYDGPQKYDNLGKKQRDNNLWNEKWRETWKHLGYEDDDYVGHIRNSLPVILNVNENFKGVLFMPNSPVVINGNGCKFRGFVVAQKFLKLKTAEDFPIEATPNYARAYYEYLYRDLKLTRDAKDNMFDCTLYTDQRGNEYYKNIDEIVFYHKAAENGTRYIQVTSSKGVIKYGNVIYAKGSFQTSTKNPIQDNIANSDNIYLNPNGQYVIIDPDSAEILYTYTLVEQEKANIVKDFTSNEKEYVKVNPMYVDQFGNVQYMPLNGKYLYDERPHPTSYSEHDEDDAEVIYNPATFNLYSVEYDSFYQVKLVNYTNLNDYETGINDVFYTTVRSNWID